MYKILVLNETGCEQFSREYNTFISALCLARMGHDVLYIGNTRFAGELYQGGYTRDVDIFDLALPETPAMLPVGFESISVPKMNATLITDPWVKGKIDGFGKTDIVFYSGNEYMATFGDQVAIYKDCVSHSLDWDNMPPCVNEIQLRRSRNFSSPPINRVVSFREHAWEHQEIYGIRKLCENLKAHELWISARYGNRSQGEIPHHTLQSEGIYWQPPLTDSGRFQMLRSATVYVEPMEHANKQGIAEALCCGIPVIARDSEETKRIFGSLVWYFGQYVPTGIWFDRVTHDFRALEHIKKRAWKTFGFASRIEYLHNIIKDLEC